MNSHRRNKSCADYWPFPILKGTRPLLSHFSNKSTPKSVLVCGNNLVKEDRSENQWVQLHFQCFSIKRKAIFFLWIERYLIRCNAGRFPAWSWLDSRQSTALLISSASEQHLRWPVISTLDGGQSHCSLTVQIHWPPICNHDSAANPSCALMITDLRCVCQCDWW